MSDAVECVRWKQAVKRWFTWPMSIVCSLDSHIVKAASGRSMARISESDSEHCCGQRYHDTRSSTANDHRWTMGKKLGSLKRVLSTFWFENLIENPSRLVASNFSVVATPLVNKASILRISVQSFYSKQFGLLTCYMMLVNEDCWRQQALCYAKI